MSGKVPPIDNLINQLTKLPGIGKKTAQRLSYFILDMEEKKVENLANAIIVAKKDTKFCKVCCNFSSDDLCHICKDDKRDRSTICVMEEPRDVVAMENTQHYKGLYHVLHGVISPTQEKSPDDLKIRELIDRLRDDEVKEIIIATNPTVEGETTALYLSKLIIPLGIKVSRIAYGIPVGGDLEFYDNLTISTALENRFEMK